MFNWRESDPIYEGTNVIEVCKDRDCGVQDLFVPLWYEVETKRLKNNPTETVVYGWDDDFVTVDEAPEEFQLEFGE